MNITRKAYNFAKEKHDGTLYNSSPYVVHCKQTAMLLAPTLDQNLIAAGYLHDILEDTDVTFDTLENWFNKDIASLVWEVTKDSEGNFSNLKTERGLMLKCADRLANVLSLPYVKDKEKRSRLFKKYSRLFLVEGKYMVDLKKKGGVAHV